VKKYWFKCKTIETNQIIEIPVIASNVNEAEDKIIKQNKYIPLEYLGWN